MLQYGLYSTLLALQTVSWPEAAVTIGLAVNTTLSAFLLQKRVSADKNQEAFQYDVKLRLRRIERRCYGEAMDDAGNDT